MFFIFASVFRIFGRFIAAGLVFFNAFGILNEERFLAPRRIGGVRQVLPLAALRNRDWRGVRNLGSIFKAGLVLAPYFTPLFIVFNTIYIAALLCNSLSSKFDLCFSVPLLVVILCTHMKKHFPSLVVREPGFRGMPWKAARIGERLSPWIAVGCLVSGFSILFL